MKYEMLLFDLDDTLLDFEANERESLEKLFTDNGFAFNKEIFDTYHRINKELWNGYEKGTLDLNEVLNTRFSKTLHQLGQTVDGVLWEMQYRTLLGQGYQLMEGAYDLCQQLSKSHRLFIITNGVTETQLNRLRLSKLYPFFENIFTSQELGYQKPAKEFFDYVKKHIKEFKADKALVIGDSLSSDIKGGYLAGIDTCWINRKNTENTSGIPITYTITKLPELYSIL
ncbi:YjjG family noncanonical pyrimidine nucleotidase [Anaerocolumna chitinilytica]|uniref:Noncanonical pyrimidine nucleotidase, YjjG family protein n=1 Tax=Anaerocolumna chitinilytica TaxID=1727145 RepID=A0A7I8DMD7_9FIRM|nr:YjjG family noncanonical pyrimidine nucleotidase [Anaerocolumna chitinilytica]BCJ99539.1 noncanonical pyrimidine nucleotidase, YjjG family protein [Anaerocolumna chitinilytica]